MKGTFVFLGALAFAFALFVPVAQAHSEPNDCSPAIEGTVTTPPSQVICKTTQSMDAKESKLSVFDSSGAQVDKGDSTVDLNDPDRKTIAVSLDTAIIKDGVYTVKWVTLSTEDNEEANGEFKFTVGSGSTAQPTAAGTTAAEPTAAPTTAVEPTVAPTAAPQPTATPQTSPATLPRTGAAMTNLGIVLFAVLGLLLLALGTAVHMRR